MRFIEIKMPQKKTAASSKDRGKNESSAPMTVEELQKQYSNEVMNKTIEIEGLKSKAKALVTYQEMYEKLKQEHDLFVGEMKQRDAESVGIFILLLAHLNPASSLQLSSQGFGTQKQDHHESAERKYGTQIHAQTPTGLSGKAIGRSEEQPQGWFLKDSCPAIGGIKGK